jgi:hypothetical protein
VHVKYSPNDLFFPIGFKHFFHYIVHLVGLPPSLNPWLSHYIYGQPLDPMKIHLFRCAHGGERMASHDAMWDGRMQDFKFYMNKLTFFCYLPFIFHVNKSTL